MSVIGKIDGKLILTVLLHNMFMQRHNPVLSLKLLCYNVICLLCFPFLPPLPNFLASIHSTHLLIGDVLTAAWRLALAWLLWSPPAADWIDALLCCPFHNTYLPVLFMKCSNLFWSLVTVQYFDLFELQTSKSKLCMLFSDQSWGDIFLYLPHSTFCLV